MEGTEFSLEPQDSVLIPLKFYHCRKGGKLSFTRPATDTSWGLAAAKRRSKNAERKTHSQGLATRDLLKTEAELEQRIPDPFLLPLPT